MFRIKVPAELRLSPGQCARIVLYTVVTAAASVLIHEAAHVVAALALGVPLDELQSGFMGINPSVTLPEWFTGAPRTVVRYAGGLTAGAGLLLFYLLYWVRKYRSNPSVFGWSLGGVTIIFAAMQFATGYLEGRYHGAYITGAMSFFSLTNLLMYGWALSAIFFHSALCPRRRMRVTADTAIHGQGDAAGSTLSTEQNRGDG